MRFAANISTMYGEHDFLGRIAAAASDGFRAVECQLPYDHPATEIAARLADHDLQLVLLNAPAGDWAAGERGLTGMPGREQEFRDGFARALEYAEALSCPRIHAMAGIPGADVDRKRALTVYRENLAWAAEQAADAGRTVLIEAINQRDMPGYLLSRQDDAHTIVNEIGSPALRVQLDLYHCQITEGDITTRLRTDLPTGRVGHIQIASVPGRHEPDEGELNYRHVFDVLDELGYDGWIGCEYIPRAGTTEGLRWRASLAR